mgnify:CR=1 FL=1
MFQYMDLKEEDFIIYCGWAEICSSRKQEFEENCRKLSQQPATFLFIDNGQEDYPVLNSYPIENWNGGKVHHIIKNKIIHLMRGQVFCIDGKTFFTMGGAMRTGYFENICEMYGISRGNVKKDFNNVICESWWRYEYPNPQEFQEGLINLAKVNNQVDYIVTFHLSTSKLLKMGYIYEGEINYMTDYFDLLEAGVEFKKWICGWEHMWYDTDIKKDYSPNMLFGDKYYNAKDIKSGF